jgi:hypothetical protein
VGDDAAESGGDAGANFRIDRWSDAAAWLGTTLTITRSSGACANTGGTWTALSDGSLKQGVRPFERGLKALEALRPISFRYRPGTPFASHDEPSARLLGLIAQDVAPHVPEIVGSMTVEVDGESRKVGTLEPGNLVYLLINAVKELAAKVAALEAAK